MPRHGFSTQTTDSLIEIVNELQRTTETLRARVESMKLDEITQLTVTNYDQLKRAMEYLENFSHAVRKAHIKCKEERGAYRQDQKKPKKKGC